MCLLVGEYVCVCGDVTRNDGVLDRLLQLNQGEGEQEERCHHPHSSKAEILSADVHVTVARRRLEGGEGAVCHWCISEQ